MIISAKIIEHPRKVRNCEVCNLPMNFRQLRLYGAAHRGDKPYVVYTHVHCGKKSREIERKLQAVEHRLAADGEYCVCKHPIAEDGFCFVCQSPLRPAAKA